MHWCCCCLALRLAAGCLATGTGGVLSISADWLHCCGETLFPGSLWLRCPLFLAAVEGGWPRPGSPLLGCPPSCCDSGPLLWHCRLHWCCRCTLLQLAAGCLLIGMLGCPAASLLHQSTCGGSSCLSLLSSSPVCTSFLPRTLAAALHPIARLGNGRQTEIL